ncbi:MAG: cysteine-rich small domain-containing protein [Lachnospiraceae bacterium]|nr:cysteine-rich small domain-containing protein [Lachnospiraceae bacterium]
MENSYRFFENKECGYFPCHKGRTDAFNCLFCYCPMYLRENCPGNPTYLETDGKRIKDCTDCMFPHLPENYDIIMQMLKE